MTKLNVKELEKIIKEVMFNQTPSMILYTGHGGCKDYLKAFHKELFPNEPYTWRTMRKTYGFLIATKGIIKRGGFLPNIIMTVNITLPDGTQAWYDTEEAKAQEEFYKKREQEVFEWASKQPHLQRLHKIHEYLKLIENERNLNNTD